MVKKTHSYFKKLDWFLICNLLILMLVGVIAIYMASSTKTAEEYIVKNYYLKQIIWIFLSLIIIALMLRVPLPIIEVFITPGYLFSVICLIIVLFMPAINGSHRWIQVGGFRLQPSEIAKLASILLVSKLIAKPHLPDHHILLRGIGGIIIPVLLILMEPDLGTSLIFFVILFSMLSVSGFPLIYLLLIISPLLSMITSFFLPIFIILIASLIFIMIKNKLSWIFVGAVSVVNLFFATLTPVMWNSLKTYQQNRILTFLDPTRDPLGAGYQIIQAKIAIGSGGLFGKGFLEGTQKNLNFLPEHHTDFIFSVIGEELGFIGCLLLIFIFLVFLSRIAYLTSKIKVKERKIATVGILTYLTFQVFVNIGMNIGVMPTTGIPLPFISYGGSNLLINTMAVGVVLKFVKERGYVK